MESSVGPKHVAIIMDGNGRWAQNRGYPRVYGHIRGAARVKGVVRKADALGIRALTLFAFSTENWNRPASEISVLWRLLKKYFLREISELQERNVRLRVIGELDRLDADVRAVILNAVEQLSQNTGLQLTFAISYGARAEIVAAARRFARQCKECDLDPDSLSEESFEELLWTSELGTFSDVDLVIRTSGEKRMSNFLLWQAAYAEYFFTETLWPDFLPEHLKVAVEAFLARDRRFGSVSRLAAVQSAQNTVQNTVQNTMTRAQFEQTL